MDLDILKAIIIILTAVGVIVFYVIWGFITIVLSFYIAAYTVALLHILFIEPVIFNTHSLFTIPYNDISDMANMYIPLYWIIILMYFTGLLKGTEKVVTIKITK